LTWLRVSSKVRSVNGHLEVPVFGQVKSPPRCG
jgi:hypothetical protein